MVPILVVNGENPNLGKIDYKELYSEMDRHFIFENDKDVWKIMTPTSYILL